MLLPFPLRADPTILWKRPTFGGASAVKGLGRSPVAGSAALSVDQIVRNKDFGMLTRGFATLEDAIGASYQSASLCVVIAHSELSQDSVRLVTELHEVVTEVGEREREQQAVVTFDAQRKHDVVRLLGDLVNTYVISLFSEESSYMPILNSCTAPAVLVYAPMGGSTGMVHVGSLTGPMVLNDVVTFVSECSSKWALLTQDRHRDPA